MFFNAEKFGKFTQIKTRHNLKTRQDVSGKTRCLNLGLLRLRHFTS